MSNLKVQDQRSLTDQLQDVWKFAIDEKMYDAANFIIEKMKNFKVEVRGKEILVQPLVSQPEEAGSKGGLLASKKLKKLLCAANKIHHWHDWGDNNEGMVVSAKSVRDLWEAINYVEKK